MFWRKQKAAIERFHPLHKALTLDGAFSVSLRRDDWEPVIQSFSQHDPIVKRRRWRMPKRVPGVLVPMLRVLAADMPPDGVLSVTTDMRGADVAGKKGPEQDLPTQRPVMSLKQWYALDPWLRLRAELRDGSVLELEVVDRVRFRRRKKRNPRGKVKVKTKTKTVQVVRATRRLAKDAAVRRPQSPPPPWLKVQVKEGRRLVIRASAKLPGNRANQTMVDRIMDVSTEPFRWTPPGTATGRTK